MLYRPDKSGNPISQLGYGCMRFTRSGAAIDYAKAERELCAAVEQGVNYTAGLPIVRTSPDHGTAYDMAGRDQADPHSMMSSIYTAIDIFKSRQAYDALQAGKMNKEK